MPKSNLARPNTPKKFSASCGDFLLRSNLRREAALQKAMVEMIECETDRLGARLLGGWHCGHAGGVDFREGNWLSA